MNLDLSSFDPNLDERLRRELGEADLTPFDPAALTAAGGRALRRRRFAVASGATAVVLALAVGGFVAQDAFSRNATPAPPMGTTATTAAPLAPEVTAIMEPLNASFGTGTVPSEIPGPNHFAVTWQRTPAPGGQDLTFSTVGDNDALTAIGGSSTVGLSTDAVTWGTGGGIQAIVGVLPAAAARFTVVQPYAADGDHASISDRAPMVGSPWQAFAVAFQNPKDIDSIVDILWMSHDAVVHDKSGAIVPSVTLTDRDHRTLYVSDAADTMGTFSGSGGDASMWLSTAEHPVLSIGRGADKDSPMDGFFGMLVPSGSTAPALTPNRSTDGFTQPQIVQIPGSDWAVLWCDYTASSTTGGAAFAKVEWTAPDGARTTVTKY